MRQHWRPLADKRPIWRRKITGPQNENAPDEPERFPVFLNSRFALGSRGRSNGALCARRNLADLESRETANRNILTELCNGVVHHLTDRHTLVLDEVLFVEAILFVELLHLSGDDALSISAVTSSRRT